MSANNKRSRKAKLVPRCATSDMELIMAEMEENHNMGENMVTNAGSEVIIKSEPESSNEGDTPKLSIEVEIEPYEDEDWHIPVKEESTEPTYSENNLPVSEAKEIKSEYDSDPEMQSILEEEAEFNKIASDPKNIAIMEKLLHDTNNLNATSTAFKTLQVEIEESSKGLDVENRINVSFIKELTTEPYEDMLKKIADNGDKCLYKCSLCNLNWLSHEGFNKHISERHSNKAVWKIETKTNSLNKFIINLVKAPVLISNRCPNCNELFSEEAFLKRHLDETFKKCLKCMKLFHGCKQLHLHMPHCGIDSGHCTCDVFTGNPDERKGKNCICGRSGKFKKCIVCQASFMDDRKLLEHQNEYHVVSTKFEMNVSLKKCTACNMTYVGKKDLHDCYVKHKRVKCAMCKKKFQTQLLLDVHVKAMAKPGIKCKVCNKDEAPANTWTSCDKIKSESDIKTEFEVDLTESNSLSALLHGSPKTKEKKSNTNRNKPKMLRCSNCGFKSNRKLYKNHVNKCCKQHTVIPKTRDYKKPAFLNGFRSIHTCLLCRKDFTSLTLYYSHFIQHGYNARQCPYCMKVLEGESFMVHCFKHIKSNFYRFIAIDQKNKNETIRTIKCRQCKEDTLETDYLTHFENHYLKYEPEGELIVREKEADVKPKLGEVPVHLFREVIRTLTEVQMYERRPTMKQCVICFKKSDRNSEMKRHLIEHLLMDAKRATLTDGYLICQICSKVYQSTNQLKCHMREHAMLSVYECQICNKTFSDSSNFAKHKKVHDLKCLKCILCLKKFSSERMYAQHLELHKTLKSTQCPICKKFFHFESAFKKHYKMMHTKPTFKCQYCMARHPSLKTLWDHLWEVHKVRKVKADCKECGASFRKLQALRLHIMNTHSYLGIERIKKMKKMKDSVTSANDNSSAVSSTSIINID